jgi:hypothetical protein
MPLMVTCHYAADYFSLTLLIFACRRRRDIFQLLTPC